MRMLCESSSASLLAWFQVKTPALRRSPSLAKDTWWSSLLADGLVSASMCLESEVVRFVADIEIFEELESAMATRRWEGLPLAWSAVSLDLRWLWIVQAMIAQGLCTVSLVRGAKCWGTLVRYKGLGRAALCCCRNCWSFRRWMFRQSLSKFAHNSFQRRLSREYSAGLIVPYHDLFVAVCNHRSSCCAPTRRALESILSAASFGDFSQKAYNRSTSCNWSAWISFCLCSQDKHGADMRNDASSVSLDHTKLIHKLCTIQIHIISLNCLQTPENLPKLPMARRWTQAASTLRINLMDFDPFYVTFYRTCEDFLIVYQNFWDCSEMKFFSVRLQFSLQFQLTSKPWSPLFDFKVISNILCKQSKNLF